MSSKPSPLLVGLSLLATAPLLAQNAEDAVVMPPAVLPATPATPAAPSRSAVDSVGKITLVDEQSSQVAALLGKITGRILLRSGELPPAKINFQSGRDLTRVEAEMALESLLALNGVAAIPEGESFLKIVPAYKSREPAGEAPHLYLDSVASLPTSDRFVARLFIFQNISYASVDPAIQLLVNKNRGGSAVAMPAPNAVLVTDSLSNIQRIEAVVQKIDAATKVVFMTLSHTRAADVVKQLKSLQSSGMKAAFVGEVGFESADVSNQVMAITHPANESRIREIISEIDTEVPPVTHSKFIPLRHADASDVVQLVQNISTGTSGTIGQNSPSTASRASSNEDGRSGSGAGVSRRQNSRAGGSGNSSPGGSAGRGAGGSEESSFSHYFTVVGDARSNGIVAHGTVRDMKQLEDLVSKIDVQLPQVRIEVVIVEVTLQDNQASGLDSLGLGFYTGTQGVVNGARNGDTNFNATQPNLPGSNSPPFAISGSLKDFSLQTVFNKTRNDSNVKLLSSPTIVTAHNAPAELKVTTQQPIITGSISVPNNGALAASSQVDYKDIGLQLDITPRIGSNGVVEMNVEQQIGSIIGNVTIDGNTQPIISNRSANSYVTAKNNETVVLAGLQSVTETKTKGRLFLLSYIPWLGDWLFSPETTQTVKTELIIFLKPHVLTQDDVVPSRDTPGLREGSLTKEISEYRLREGAFEETRQETTIFEQEAGKKKRAAERREAQRVIEEKKKAEREAEEANSAKAESAPVL